MPRAFATHPCQREGSFFGFDEAQRNFGNIMEGLRRSSDRMDVEDMLADEVSQAEAKIKTFTNGLVLSTVVFA